MNAFIQIYLEAEQNIVSRQRVPIRKSQASAEFQSVSARIRRNTPGLGQSGFRELRVTIDVNQVRDHGAGYNLRSVVFQYNGIQRFWFGGQRNHQVATLETAEPKTLN